MGFKRIALCKLCMTDVTFVGFFSRVNSKVALQLERVRTGVGAVGTLVRSLSSVTSVIIEIYVHTVDVQNSNV